MSRTFDCYIDYEKWYLKEYPHQTPHNAKLSYIDRIKNESDRFYDEIKDLRGAVYKFESLVDEQATKIQEARTENESLKSDIRWEIEVKNAYSAKLKEAMVTLGEAYELIEELFNSDTLTEYDRSYLDELFRRSSMFLQSNIDIKNKLNAR